MTCCVLLGHTLGNAQALIHTIANTVPKMEEFSVGDTGRCGGTGQRTF